MKTVTEQLTTYATYHRDRRNIATHFIGIPLIVLATMTMLARPAFALGGVALAPMHVAAALAALYYLRLDLRLGVAMAALLALLGYAALAIASQSTAVWLGAGIGAFVVGWVFQLVGHVFEGRKPAFVDDLVGLLIGPLFVAAEAGFAVGWRDELRAAIERVAGPTRGAGDHRVQSI